MIGRIVFPSPIFPNTLLDENMFWRVLSGVAGGCVELYVWNWTSLYTSIPAHTAHCAQLLSGQGERKWSCKQITGAVVVVWPSSKNNSMSSSCCIWISWVAFLRADGLYYLFVCLLQIQCNAILVVSIQRLKFIVCLNLSFIDYQTKLQWLAIG